MAFILRLSKTLHLLKNKECYALYDKISSNLCFGDKLFKDVIEAFKNGNTIEKAKRNKALSSINEEELDKIIGHLVNLHFLVQGGEILEYNKISRLVQNPTKISELYFVFNDFCNLSCKYCTIKLNKKTLAKRVMTKKIIDATFERFVGSNFLANPLRVTLYGGEPLLHWNLVKYLIQKTKKNTTLDISLQLITNGTLITPKVSRLLEKHNVFTIVSLDGPPNINDQMRIYPDGKSTSKDILQGINYLKKSGVRFGISSVLGKHNIAVLPQAFKWLIDLEPSSIGLVFLHQEALNPILKKDFAIKQMLAVLDLARESGVFFVQAMRKIEAFVNQKPNLRDCPACGEMLRVMPTGDLTTCHNFALRGEHIIGNVLDTNLNLHTSLVFNTWRQRTQLNNHECKDCFAVFVCGGGCPFDAFLKTGSIFSPDEKGCLFSNGVLEWAIWTLYNETRKKWLNSHFYGPTLKDRQLVMKNHGPKLITSKDYKIT